MPAELKGVGAKSVYAFTQAAHACDRIYWAHFSVTLAGDTSAHCGYDQEWKKLLGTRWRSLGELPMPLAGVCQFSSVSVSICQCPSVPFSVCQWKGSVPQTCASITYGCANWNMCEHQPFSCDHDFFVCEMTLGQHPHPSSTSFPSTP